MIFSFVRLWKSASNACGRSAIEVNFTLYNKFKSVILEKSLGSTFDAELPDPYSVHQAYGISAYVGQV
jgi:hypothetical protein